MHAKGTTFDPMQRFQIKLALFFYTSTLAVSYTCANVLVNDAYRLTPTYSFVFAVWVCDQTCMAIYVRSTIGALHFLKLRWPRIAVIVTFDLCVFSEVPNPLAHACAWVFYSCRNNMSVTSVPISAILDNIIIALQCPSIALRNSSNFWLWVIARVYKKGKESVVLRFAAYKRALESARVNVVGASRSCVIVWYLLHSKRAHVCRH